MGCTSSKGSKQQQSSQKEDKNITQDGPKQLDQQNNKQIVIVEQLERLPETLNQLSKQQYETLGKYIYNYSQFEVNNCVEKGPCKLVDGSIYVGQWLNDQKNGKGCEYLPDGSIYEGYWLNNERHGQGRFIFHNGNVYEGEWKNNKPFGQGKFIHNQDGYKFATAKEHQNQVLDVKQLDVEPDYSQIVVKSQIEKFQQFVYDCPQFEDQEAQTLGPHLLNDNSVYTGQWKNHLRQGRGKQRYQNGQIYEGYWLNDLKHGKGRMIYENGNVYEGEWELDLPIGQGNYTYFNAGHELASKIIPTQLEKK